MTETESRPTAKAEDTMSAKDKLELIRWLIDRIDKLRESVANRAAIVVSANALLLAGMTFLLDQTQPSVGQYSPVEKIGIVPHFP